jgi:hypothetical protein
MGEAPKSKDVNVIRWPSCPTRYHLFLLAAGTLLAAADCRLRKGAGYREEAMHGLIYLVGLIVVILAILSFFGLR